MKITLICTTYNEAEHIQKLLDSIAKQTLKPHQIIITDANSTDATRDIIQKAKKTLNLPITLINKKLNRSQGRNLAIQKAKYKIIAVTDAGCILDKHWLERITKPLIDDKADSVAGYYLPITPTCFEKSVAPFVSVMPDKLNPQTYLPSSRSVAFTKEAWEKVGHYPDHLNYCEDLVFAQKLKENTRLYVEKKALVYWQQKSTYQSFFSQITNYARGDVQARYEPHLYKIFTVFLRYTIFILFLPIYPLYLLIPILKHYKYVKHPGCIIHLPALQITSDFAIMYGTLTQLSSTSSRN